MKMRAMVSCPQREIYLAIFYYTAEGSPAEVRTMPHIEIPCDSYEHARSVVDAFNMKG